MYEIKTSNYLKERKVLIDGIEATIRPLGAGSQLAFSQMERRRELLDKRLKAGTDDFEQMEKDIADLEKMENRMLDFFNQTIRDGSEDNAKIGAWLTKTPLEVIQVAFEDMQRQFVANDEKKDGDARGTNTEAAA